MKKIFLVLTLLVVSLMADVKWMSYDDAIDEAKKSDKLVMVMLSREGCPACEYMEDIVLKDKAVQAELAKDFLAVHLDIHNDFLPSGMTYIGTPTFHFLNKHEMKKGRIDGGANVKDFMQELQNAKANR
jgi:thiol-disulfide isomerase/thioredoxin